MMFQEPDEDGMECVDVEKGDFTHSFAS